MPGMLEPAGKLQDTDLAAGTQSRPPAPACVGWRSCTVPCTQQAVNQVKATTIDNGHAQHVPTATPPVEQHST